MTTKSVKVVIGANWGDEGKGLMTDYFCHKAVSNNEKCIVVCTNGGAQRGHTVVTPSGIRHVFHHFGSGTFAGADTYLPREYVLNPLIFREEWEELENLGYAPRVYVHPNSVWSTPYDMMINQIIEDIRGDGRHGSCGVGIWETLVRTSKDTPRVFREFSTVSEIQNMSRSDFVSFMSSIRDLYVPVRLIRLGGSVPKEWEDVLSSCDLVSRFENDLLFMLNHITIVPEGFLNSYDTVVFENAQGLMLDQNYGGDIRNTTPSNTGLQNVCDLVDRVFSTSNIEVCYVTRTYATRHGVGEFPRECGIDKINKSLYDKTNVPNPYQGSIRYGLLDSRELVDRVYRDFDKRGRYEYQNWTATMAVTHMNEYAWEGVDFLIDEFGSIYVSDSESRESVRKT